MTRRFLVFLLIAAACSPTAAQPSPTPTPIATASATATASAAATSAPTASPSPTPIALPSSAFIAAAGNGVVWALVASTHLFLSTDRGTTWTERTVPQPGGAQEIAFVSADEGWALGPASPGTQCQTQSVSLWQTSDGARTWQRMTPAGIADAQCKDTIAFVDRQRGYLIAHDPNSAPLIYRTSDGGKTWAASPRLSDPPGITTGPAGFELQPGPVADFGSVLFVDVFANQNGTAKHLIYRSTDRGATWSYDVPSLQSTRVVFLTPTHWIQIVPRDSRETVDGGTTWSLFATDYQQAAPIDPQIVFGDATAGYATVRGAIQRTTDGGAHWTSIRTPGT